MMFSYHAMPSLIYVRPCHVKYDELEERLKNLPKGHGLIVHFGGIDFKTMQMRIRAAIRHRGFDSKSYSVKKSSEGILIERKP